MFTVVTFPVMLGKQRAGLWRPVYQRVHASSVLMENHRWLAVPDGHTLPETHLKQTDALLDSYLALRAIPMSTLICALMYI